MPKSSKSPLAPKDTEAISAPGAYPGSVGSTAPSTNTILVGKGHAKGGGDPSMGTATSRPADLERNGAQYRVRHEFAPGGPPNEPYSGANLSKTPVVQDAQAPTDDKNWSAGTNGMVSRHFVMHRDGQGAEGVR